MSGKNKYQYEEQVFRYLRNEMTEQERNAFEREMQKDPFLAEAVEGLSHGSVDSFEEDISILKKNLEKEKSSKRILWWSAAASLLVIVISTFMLIDLRDKTHQLVSESSPVATDTSKLKAPEQLAVQPVPEKMEKQEQEFAETEVVENELVLMDEEEASQDETAPKDKSLKIPEVKGLSKYKPKQVEIPIEEEQTIIEDDFFMIVESEEAVDTGALQVVARQEKAFAFTNAAEESDSSMEEVVVVGYGTRKKMNGTGAVSPTPVEEGNRPTERKAQPAIGWEEYHAYLDSVCSNPEMGLPDKKVVVKLSFVVSENGEAEQFEILRSTDEAYNPEAIRIIQSGANWLPKLDDSRPTSEKISLRLVFKPEN